MNQQIKKARIIRDIIFAVTLIIGGILAYQYWGMTEGIPAKDEIAIWKIYSKPEVNFTFQYPKGWEIKEEYQYKSAACQCDPECTGVHYIFLNRIDDRRPAGMGEKEHFGIAINMPQCNGIKYSDLPRNNWICLFDKNLQILSVYEQIKESFRIIKNKTAGWKTYRNEKYGFEVKYLENWYSRFTITDEHFEITNGDDINNSVEIRTPLAAAGSAFIDIPFDEDILISGNISAKKKTELNQAGDYKWWRIIIQWRDKEGGVIIYDYPYKGVEGIDYLNIFDQMLSTFRFLE